jgi:hypothetical protein
VKHMFVVDRVSGVLQGCGGGRHVPSFVRYEELVLSIACEWGISWYWFQFFRDDDLWLMKSKTMRVLGGGWS